MKLTKPLYTAMGEVVPVSFQAFIDILKVERHEYPVQDDNISFPTMTSYSHGGAWINEDEPNAEAADVSSYRTRTIQFQDKDKLKDQLISQSKIGHVWYKRLDELVEELYLTHANEYGSPTCIVNVGRRMWMPANPEDFKLHERNDKYVLVCNAQSRTIVFKINKMAEVKSFVSEINKIMEK